MFGEKTLNPLTGSAAEDDFFVEESPQKISGEADNWPCEAIPKSNSQEEGKTKYCRGKRWSRRRKTKT